MNLDGKPSPENAIVVAYAAIPMDNPSTRSIYTTAYDAARHVGQGCETERLHAMLRAVVMEARTEADWGAADALADLIRERQGVTRLLG